MLLAHLTDLHIKPRDRLAFRRVDTAACLEAAVAHVNALDPRPDAVLVTGDLTDLGLAEEYGLLRELLQPLRPPVFLTAGNHDARDALRAAFADHPYLPAEGALRFAIEDFPLRIVALDSLVPGAPGGALGADQLAWLDATLAAAADRATVVAVHHPPFVTGIAHMDAMGLADAAALRAVVARHPQVERVLSGHVHRPIAARLGGAIAMVAPSVAHQVALDLRAHGPARFRLEPPGYLLHLLSPEGGVVTHGATIGDWPGPFPFSDEPGGLAGCAAI